MDIDIGLSRIRRRINGATRVLALDLETLVKDGFLKNESIVAISVGTLQGNYDVMMADPNNYNEYDLLSQLQDFVDSYQPEVIIGYNHVSYDITLINTKLVSLPYSKQLFALKFFFGTSYLLDMMYACALDMRVKTGDYIIRSLRKIVNSEFYNELDLMRVKENIQIDGMNPAEAVEYLWKNDAKKLREYSLGDVHDVIELYKSIFKY
ncbi:MAG: hypothetical protein B2I18_03280 [Cuniculiplasma sp. C_DKE]|nr:MAG: hypothetical protein B2I18_03280 [Cuniculiplasma sp. C_DKE]